MLNNNKKECVADRERLIRLGKKTTPTWDLLFLINVWIVLGANMQGWCNLQWMERGVMFKLTRYNRCCVRTVS